MDSLAERLYFASPVTIQNALVSLMGYRLYAKRYTGIYHELRQLVQESREWSRKQRETYQSEQLFIMAKHCRQNIPFYQKLFAEYGLHENDLTNISDLKKLPILTKNDLRSNISDFKQDNKKPFMIQHTSGSTGTPLALQVNEKTYKLAMSLVVDHEEYHGVPFGARRATFAGRMIQPHGNTTPPFSRYNKAENQRLYSSYHLNEKTFDAYRKDLDEFRPIEIIGYPSAIYDLATNYIKAHTKPNFIPKAIITNSETLLSWQRQRIERVFNCSISDYYGTAEYVIFAGQDNSKLYKTNPVIGITEVLTTEETPFAGNLIATSLSNYTMPLLRYDVGDTANLPQDICKDSIHVEKIESINGRVDDYIITSDDRKIGRIDHVFKGANGLKEAQIIQQQRGKIKINIVKETYEELNETDLILKCKQRLGPDFHVTIDYVDHIPRGKNGKFRAVIKEFND